MTEREKPSKEEVRAKLKAFLAAGETDDVASILVHALNDRAEKMAQKKESNKPVVKPKKK